jgi:hypothetical protein
MLQDTSSAASVAPPLGAEQPPSSSSLPRLLRSSSRCLMTRPSSWPALLFSLLDISPRLLLQAGLSALALSISAARQKRHRRHHLLLRTSAISAKCTSVTRPSRLPQQRRYHRLLGCCPAPPPLPQLRRALESRPEASFMPRCRHCIPWFSAALFSRLPVSAVALPRAGHAPQPAPIAGWSPRGPPAACS